MALSPEQRNVIDRLAQLWARNSQLQLTDILEGAIRWHGMTDAAFIEALEHHYRTAAGHEVTVPDANGIVEALRHNMAAWADAVGEAARRAQVKLDGGE